MTGHQHHLLVLASLLLLVQNDVTSERIALDDDPWKKSVWRNRKEFEDFEIVTPVSVDNDGNHVRRKREVTSSDDPLFYWVEGFGEKFHLELTATSNLLAPGFSIYRRLPSKSEVPDTVVEHPDLKCFYSGRLKTHNYSRVAVSNCDGLKGFIRTDSTDYLIEPLPRQLYQRALDSPDPHVLYRRSARRPRDVTYQGNKHSNQPQTHYCGKKKRFMPRPPKHPEYFPDEYSLRKKRSTYRRPRLKERNVESLVVVDQEMVKAHGVDNITTYVLTIFNMVAALYNDGTIGNNISVVLVALVLLEGDEPGLVLNNNAERSLHSFCQWQSTLRDANGSHHDHAVLLTGLDICSWKNEPCDTLGYAPISGMCSKYRSCTINEDTGLALAFTIAHESGHNFGMVHDGDGNLCANTRGSIMSPTLTGLDGTFSWSSCSRKDLDKFLSSAQASCLENDPQPMGEFKFPDILPGELYDADMQCKWQFGHKSKLCMFEFGKDICKALWCQKSGRQCETKFLPAAEGTSCGPNKWCRRGVCVEYGNHGPPPINGQWSVWSEWSTCTRTCGGGVMYQERECNNPRPQYGGKYCEGESRIYRMCNIQACPPDVIDFRAEQCAAFNSRPFRGVYYKWKPYSKGLSEHVRCKLYCMPEDLDFFFALSSKVIDGTPCRSDSTDVCVEGECKEVGCDYIIDSGSRLDACGVCNGDNSTCLFIRGNYTEQPISNNYYEIVTIPSGSRSIHIWEMNISASYLAIRNTSDFYYLTGDWTVDWPGRYRVASAVFHYHRPYNGPEMLSAEGPLDQDIVIELLLQGTNPGVGYEYTIPMNLSPTNHTTYHSRPFHYVWRATVSDCSEPCSGGEMVTTAQCFRNDDQQVDSSMCESSTKPDEGVSPCNTHSCPPHWVAHPWKSCSKPCGGGKQKRRVQCMVKLNATKEVTVRYKLCDQELKPPRRRKCNLHECPPTWHASDWSKCSTSCGEGNQKRKVLCRGSSKGGPILPDKMCKHQEKPFETKRCQVEPCPRPIGAGHWVASAWGRCSRSCGGGQQMRVVRCVDRITHRGTDAPKCNENLRPQRVQRCNMRPCPTPFTLKTLCTDSQSEGCSQAWSSSGFLQQL